MSHTRFNSRVGRLLVRAFIMVMGFALIIPANPASAEPVFLPDGTHKGLDIGFQLDARTHQLLVYNYEPCPVTFSRVDGTYRPWSVTLPYGANALMCMDPAAPDMRLTISYGADTATPVVGYANAHYRGTSGSLELTEKNVAEARVMLSEATAAYKKARIKYKKAQRRLTYAKSQGLNRLVVKRATVAKTKAYRQMVAARRYRDLKARKLAYEQGLLQTLLDAYTYCDDYRIN